MDQLKDILKQMIKYRFWIAVGISALLPMIAYLVGSGPIQTKAAAKTQEITQANDGVKKFGSGDPLNAQYKPIVDQKKDELTKDVNASWKMLYERQAKLLTWPANVEERFVKWERQWPKDVDPGAVQLAIIEYVTAYPKFVTEVYQAFRPFDVMEGTGIVSAPTEEVLLHPFQFTIENPPELGKVWAAQERLWTQRTIIDVIAKVNKDAQDWTSATIKQINLLEVGNSPAQDQRSLAKGETLAEAPAIANPAAPPPPPTDPAAGATPGGTPGQPQQTSADSVYYIKPATENNQFKILPFQLSILIEQDHIQDLLCELENSPMAIQVMEFEMSKPVARVTKPVKGQNVNLYEFAATSSAPTMTGRTFYGVPRAAGAMGGGPSGIDKRSTSRADLRKQEEQRVKSVTGHSIHDPYFNIIEVTVYGQARFYNRPPAEPAPPPSEATPAAAPGPEGAAPAAEPAKTEAPKAEGEPAKTETPKPEGEPAKAEAPKAGAEAPKAETPKPEGESAKAEAPKEAQPAPTPAPAGEAPKEQPSGTPPK